MLSWNSNTVAAAVSPGCCPAPASFSSTVLWRLSARWLAWLSSWPGPGAGLVTLCEEETDTPTTPPARLTTPASSPLMRIFMAPSAVLLTPTLSPA